MFNHLSKMEKNKNVRVRFKVVNGKVHLKNLQVTPDEYKRIAEIINHMVDRDVLRNHNFSASFNITL